MKIALKELIKDLDLILQKLRSVSRDHL